MVRRLLEEITSQLAAAPQLDVAVRSEAARETRLLVAATLGLSIGDLARRAGGAVTDHERDRIRAAVRRRVRGEPLAYVVGTAAFRHLTLRVDQRVLIPRPETEIVVENALRVAAIRPGGIAVDIGTGSGAIALSLATEGRFELVLATDVSTDALEVAIANASGLCLHTDVEFRLGADLAPLEGLRARVIVSNPPYIAYGEATSLPASVRDWEPALALFASDEGLARYDVLLAGANRYLETGGFVVLEVDSRRARDTAALAERYGWLDVRLHRDLSGRERVLVARGVGSSAPVIVQPRAVALAKALRTYVPGPEAR